jgi:hypothetical protein
MATLEDCVIDRNIYDVVPHKLQLTFDLIEGEMNLTGEIWERTDGL